MKSFYYICKLMGLAALGAGGGLLFMVLIYILSAFGIFTFLPYLFQIPLLWFMRNIGESDNMLFCLIYWMLVGAIVALAIHFYKRYKEKSSPATDPEKPLDR